MGSQLKKIETPAEGPNGIPTLNKMGFMATTLDFYSDHFISWVTAQANSRALEVGPAFGYATLAALDRSKTLEIAAVDLDPAHIQILLNNCPEDHRSRLEAVAGDFLDLEFAKNSFDGILAVRVLHFMDGSTIRRMLAKCYQVLKPGGKLFLLSDSPYIKDAEKFVPEFERRLQNGDEWPGLVEDIRAIGSSCIGSLPRMFHFLDPVVLQRELERAGFENQEVKLVPRNDYGESARLDGREGIGGIGIKPRA